jgi:putative PIN family toxin of toxin-antitoxin system
MANKRTAKVILDTNWYISASINRRSRRIVYNILADQNLDIFYSKELLHEYQEDIRRPKFRKIISEPQVLRFLTLLLPKLSETKIDKTINVSRDPNDNYLLAMSLEIGADYLITGDDDLLVMKTVGITKIVNMAEFLQEVRV